MKTFQRAVLFVVTLGLIALPFIVFFKAQALTDWWQLRNYTPPADVTSLAKQDTLTPYAEHVFYVNHPDVESDPAQFRSDCSQSEKTIVLGCYHSNQDGIFVYNVNDPRLNGVLQVTSAHEMLHAAYDRLSTKDRDYVDGLLQDYYKTQTDQRIIDTVNAYRQSEPNDVVNEMHSIFGTEVTSLPPALEQYYQRYFINRSAVTSLANNYQSEFTSRSDQIKADDAQLAVIKAQIDREEIVLARELSKINSDRARLDSLRSSGDIAQYNAGVASFNAEVNDYNSGVQTLKTEIATYNQLVADRNALASELANLSKAIDTRLTPQTTQ